MTDFGQPDFDSRCGLAGAIYVPHRMGILPPSSGGSRCLRCGRDDLLQQAVGLVVYRGHVLVEQYGMAHKIL